MIILGTLNKKKNQSIWKCGKRKTKKKVKYFKIDCTVCKGNLQLCYCFV